ncbi:MAG: hypothetical protein L6R37_006745 [Teloschistes peruensis]|nr:MAG: hypothetical protein L6R37_006745 [Teloschistes peruensis]
MTCHATTEDKEHLTPDFGLSKLRLEQAKDSVNPDEGKGKAVDKVSLVYKVIPGQSEGSVGDQECLQALISPGRSVVQRKSAASVALDINHAL